MDEAEIASVFRALSSPMRLRILRQIKNRQLCVNAITAHLAISQSAVSQHLGVLRAAGLVEREPYGSIVHYRLNKRRLEQFKRAVRKTLGREFVQLPR